MENCGKSDEEKWKVLMLFSGIFRENLFKLCGNFVAILWIFWRYSVVTLWKFWGSFIDILSVILSKFCKNCAAILWKVSRRFCFNLVEILMKGRGTSVEVKRKTLCNSVVILWALEILWRFCGNYILRKFYAYFMDLCRNILDILW